MIHRKHAVLLVACWASIATAQITETKLVASDGVFDDFLGVSVSLSNDYALVGAYGDDDNAFNAGAAYIFHFNGSTWVQEAKLHASDGSSEDYFGSSVSLSGDYALVGASGDDDIGSNSGSAYVFHFDGSNWVQQAKLTTSDGSANDYFGHSVSVSDDRAIISALYDTNVNGSGAGSAYVFHRNGSTWVEHTKLIAGDGVEGDNFGRSVSVSGDFAIIGAPYENQNAPFAGAAYVFHYNGSAWTEQDKLLASDGGIGDYFGWTVSLSGDKAIIGALYNSNPNGPSAGSAYTFHYDGSNWLQHTKLLASDGEIYDWFGNSVSLAGDYAIVGCYSDDDNGDASGSAYIYYYDGSSWLQLEKLLASDGSGNDQFGISVSISGEYAVAGAWWDNARGSSSGSAYVYSGFTIPGSVLSCDDFTFFNAKCNMSGTAQAMVKLAGDWSGQSVTFDLDGDDHIVTLLSNGTNSFGRMLVPGAGSGSHTVTLEDPAGCFNPVTFNCQVDAADDAEWEALLTEYEEMAAGRDADLSAGTRNIEQPDFGLTGNYPNPFNPSTRIEYTLRVSGYVTLRIYDVLGREVVTLVEEPQTAGYRSVVWNGRNDLGTGVASGIYIYRMTAGSFVETKRMLLLK